MADDLVTYSIDYQGKTYSIDGPPGQTQQQVEAEVKKRVAQPEVPKSAAEKLPSSEPDFGTNFMGGMTSLPRGAGQLLKETTGISLGKTSQQTGEGTVPGKKAPMAEADPNSYGYLAGQFASGAGAAGAAMKAIPAARGVLGATAMGGTAGLLDPVENIAEHNSYFKQKEGQVIGGLTLGFGFGMAGKALTPGAEWIVSKLLPGSGVSVEDRAVNTVLHRINKDNKWGAPSATDMLNLVEAARLKGKPMILPDFAQEKGDVRRLGGRIARSEGGGPQSNAFLTARDKAAPARIQSDIAQNIWAGASKYSIGQELMAARQAAAKPAYAALDRITSVAPSEHLERLLVNPEIEKGLAWGFRLERNAADAAHEPFEPHMMGIDLDAQGHIKFINNMPNMRVLDMGKRGLDAMIAAERDANGRLTADGQSLVELRNAYLKEVDAMDTEGLYKTARQTWQGPSRSLDMLKTGYSVFERDPEENAKLAASLDEGDKQFLLAGLAQQLRERVLKAGLKSNEAARLMNSEWAQMQLTPFMKDKTAAKEFIEAVANERAMFDTKTELIGGSQTAERLAEGGVNLEDMRPGARLLHHASKRNYALLLGETLRILQDLKGKNDPELEDKIAQILFDPNVANTEMGKRIAAGRIAQSNSSKLVDFANLLKSAAGPAAAGTTAALPSTHPHRRKRNDSEGN